MNVHELALAGLNDHRLFTFLDLAGTFAFAISGAVAARDRGLDWFGVIAIAFAVACGGGVLRDLCIGAVPPAGLTDWRYLAVAIVAALMTMATNALVVRLAHPVILFDSVGLGLFAVTGAQKAMIFLGPDRHLRRRPLPPRRPNPADVTARLTRTARGYR